MLGLENGISRKAVQGLVLWDYRPVRVRGYKGQLGLGDESVFPFPFMVVQRFRLA
jgi:hypothetical protein